MDNKEKVQKIKQTVNSNLKVGDIIQLGVYPQGEHGEIEPIEWIVLDIQDNVAIVTSKYILDVISYNETFYTDKWKECTLRKWLNFDFYHQSKLDEAPLLLNHLEDNVADPLYLLTIEEAKCYFNNHNRGAHGTPYAEKRCLHTAETGKHKGEGYYWLGTRSYWPRKHSLVNINGLILEMGPNITSTIVGVRPAARVLIDLL